MTKILVVDDEEAIREIIILMIEMNGNFQIVEASSGNSAVEKIQEYGPFDIVFCDFRMNDGDGGVVYKYMREKCPETPYVLVSSEIPEDHIEYVNFSEDNQLNAYLPKPIEAADLSMMLVRVQDLKDHKEEEMRRTI